MVCTTLNLVYPKGHVFYDILYDIWLCDYDLWQYYVTCDSYM